MRVLSYLVGSQCPGQLNRHRIPQTNGFAGLADAVTVLLNSAMVGERSEHLGVPFKLSPPCVGFFVGSYWPRRSLKIFRSSSILGKTTNDTVKGI